MEGQSFVPARTISDNWMDPRGAVDFQTQFDYLDKYNKALSIATDNMEECAVGKILRSICRSSPYSRAWNIRTSVRQLRALRVIVAILTTV